jgi:hypothetical protein
MDVTFDDWRLLIGDWNCAAHLRAFLTIPYRLAAAAAAVDDHRDSFRYVGTACMNTETYEGIRLYGTELQSSRQRRSVGSKLAALRCVTRLDKGDERRVESSARATPAMFAQSDAGALHLNFLRLDALEKLAGAEV